MAVSKAISPIDGKEVEVKEIREHPQFPGKFIIESLEDGYQWTHPLPTFDELAKVYGEDYNAMYERDPSKSPNFILRRSKAQVSFMKKHCGESGMNNIKFVAEAGAGWGELSRALIAELPGIELRTYELDHDSVKSIKESGIDSRYGLLEDEEKEESSLDLIMASHTTEHFPEPRVVFQKYFPLLKPGGFLFLEIPLENPVPNWWGMDPSKPYWVGHLHYFGKGHLERMLTSLGYEIVGKSCHDHTVSPGYVMPGSKELYDVDSVPEEMDTEESTAEFPKVLRLLAKKPV